MSTGRDGGDVGARSGGDPGREDVAVFLDRLEVESKRRELDLLELSDEVPAAVSRVRLVRSLVAGVRDLLPARSGGAGRSPGS